MCFFIFGRLSYSLYRLNVNAEFKSVIYIDYAYKIESNNQNNSEKFYLAIDYVRVSETHIDDDNIKGKFESANNLTDFSLQV